MRIEGEHGSIEVSVGPEADDYAISAATDNFSGKNPRLSIGGNALRQFVADLELLERERRGEARLSAMSPDTFELTIRIIDPLGHVSVRATTGRGRYEGHRYLTSTLSIEFGIDPTILPFKGQSSKRQFSQSSLSIDFFYM